MIEIRVHRILEQTKMAGPGLRFCLWVQGCSRKCKGCAAKETWSFDGGTAINIDQIFILIKNTLHIEGVTFLGGEPFEQAESLAELAYKIKSIGLSVVTFSGYIYDDLISLKDNNIKRLLSYTDLLIDGAFVEEKFDLSRPWVGSSNQKYNFLTNRYTQNDLCNIHNQLEIRISPNGKATINGMGNFEQVKKFL